MEQLQQLLDILKQTPEFALWGLGIYFLFILLKLASWVIALKLIANYFIKRLFDFKERKLDSKDKEVDLKKYTLDKESEDNKIKLEFKKHSDFEKMLDSTIYSDSTPVLKLLMSINNGKKLHESDIEKAIKKLKE